MVNELDVLDVLKQLTDVSETESRTVTDLCRQCFESLVSELREDADTEDRRIISAAAAEAFYKLCIKEKAAAQAGISSFKAGDLSVTQDTGETDGKLRAAQALYETERKKLAPLLKDTGFFVGKVDI